MPIRRVILDLRGVTGVKKTIKDMERIFGKDILPTNRDLDEIAKKIEKKYMRPMLGKLREQPPKRKYPKDYPIQFTSDNQRKKVMSLLKGKPYRRTNRLSNGWIYKSKVKGRRISIEVYNKEEYSKFVVGEIGTGSSKRSIRRYNQPIQDFHEKTGWTPAYTIAQPYIKAAQKEAISIINDWLNKRKG